MPMLPETKGQEPPRSKTNARQIKELGEALGRAANMHTGSLRFNYRQGRLINWNIELSQWPIDDGT